MAVTATADLLAAAASAAPAVQVKGWTWAATMGALQNIILVGGGGGIAGLIVRASVQLKRIANERAKQDDDRDGARWNEMMGLNERQNLRIEKLEGDLREERKRCDEEVAALRKQHADEMQALRKDGDEKIRVMNERFEQLQRTVFQSQQSTATLLASTTFASSKALEANERLKGAVDKLGDVE